MDARRWIEAMACESLKQRENEIELVHQMLLAAVRKYATHDICSYRYWRRKALEEARRYGVTEEDITDSVAQSMFSGVPCIPGQLRGRNENNTDQI
jgi:hypothetical protein